MKKIHILVLVFLCLSAVSVRAQVDDVLIFTGANGANPYGALTLSGKRLYGTTSHGGTNGGTYGDGTVFAIDTDGKRFKQLVDFNGTDSAEGSLVYSTLTLAGNKLFGTTTLGGAGSEGCIFSVDTGGGNYKDLFDFSSPNGVEPWSGSLVLIGYNLYGLTSGGGTGTGVIFRVDTSGKNYKVLFDLDLADGSDSYGSLTLVGNKFYGMGQFGGTNDDGTVFSVDTSGALSSFRVLVNFDDASYPEGSLPLANVTFSNGKLYGMTAEGGAHNEGVIFSVDTSGNNYKDMFDFDGTNGYGPSGSLLLVDSILYGMTTEGGTHGAGNIFSIDTSGKIYTDMNDFTGTNADIPDGSLILSNGTFYGTTYEGGAGQNNKGVVFSSNTCKLSVTIDSANVACYGGSTGSAIAVLAGGTSPFSYQWTDNSGTGDTITALTAGTYSVTVTDTRGCLATAYTTIIQPVKALTASHDSVDDNGTCNGFAAVTASGGTPPYTYLWKIGEQITDTIKNQCAGTYSVTVTDSNGCTLTTSVTIKSSAGINIIGNSPAITIYPEPTNGYFTIEGIMQGEEIELYDYTGQLLSRTIADNATMHLDISDKASGIYLIQILNKDGSLTTQEKMVKM